MSCYYDLTEQKFVHQPKNQYGFFGNREDLTTLLESAEKSFVASDVSRDFSDNTNFTSCLRFTVPPDHKMKVSEWFSVMKYEHRRKYPPQARLELECFTHNI